MDQWFRMEVLDSDDHAYVDSVIELAYQSVSGER